MANLLPSHIEAMLQLADAISALVFSLDQTTGELSLSGGYDTENTITFSLSDFSYYSILYDNGAYSPYIKSFLDAYYVWSEDPVHRSLHGSLVGIREATLLNFRKEE